MKCKYCGKDSPDTNTYCDWCGERLVLPQRSKRGLQDALARVLDGKYEDPIKDTGFVPYRPEGKKGRSGLFNRSILSDNKD